MKNSEVNEPLASYGKPLGFEQVWLMFQETNKEFEETKKQIRENDRMLTEKFKETDKMLSKKFNETDKMLSEKFNETDKRIKELSALFTSQWGKLVESLVEGDLIKLLNEKGIDVEQTVQRVKGNHKGQNYEYDIIAVNGDEIVIVEVKTTLRPPDVNDFHERLWKAKKYLSQFRDNKIFGAMAFITTDGAAERMAEKMGFFVIKATGSSSSIVNGSDFKPKAF